jgi:hypothetical protein
MHLKTLLPFTLIIAFTTIYTSCSLSKQEKGKLLAEKYCGSCHLHVAPAMLDKAIWKDHVLPAMAPKLGIGVWQNNEYFSKPVNGANNISIEDWKNIVAYYEALAPDTLAPAKAPQPLAEDLRLFELLQPEAESQQQTAMTTMVSINPFTGDVYSSTEAGATLYKWDRQLKALPAIKLQSTAVDMNWRAADTALLTCIGNMRAVDVPTGVLWEVHPTVEESRQVKTIGMGLPRPVQSIPADFNKDGRMDYLVCGFGHNYGGLYVLQQTADEEYTKQPVWEVPGAIHAVAGDFDKDGWPDIMALFAYGDEGIWLFRNDHKGGFKQQQLLRFPPVQGSTGFQVVDMNKDGLPDILYTAGDNGDYSMELKPFHGVYLYLNKGDLTFEQAWFYPVNGCTKAVAADFDVDGDLDIASIAFFADLKHRPEEKFILFSQEGPVKFIPHVMPALKGAGRWICMDIGDYDRDGDPDIVLGNYSKGFIIQGDFKPDWNLNTPLILLRNISK